MNEVTQALAIAQQKLKAVNTLTNCIAKIDNAEDKNEIAYNMHQIIEADDFTSTQARLVMKWNIKANKDLFINA